MKAMLPALLAVFICLSSEAEESKQQPKASYIKPFPIVAIPASASRAHKAAAKKVADALNIKILQEAKHNPVCCVWIEVTGWTPHPGKPGYVIINQPGGSLISAANEESLSAAVARFIGSIRTTNGVMEVPEGLLTDYPLTGTLKRESP